MVKQKNGLFCAKREYEDENEIFSIIKERVSNKYLDSSFEINESLFEETEAIKEDIRNVI